MLRLRLPLLCRLWGHPALAPREACAGPSQGDQSSLARSALVCVSAVVFVADVLFPTAIFFCFIRRPVLVVSTYLFNVINQSMSIQRYPLKATLLLALDCKIAPLLNR
jgi:hypothetical protein